MKAWQLLRAAALVAAPCCAQAQLPCGGWVENGETLELHGPRGHLVLRAAPEALAALRRTLLFRCEGQPAQGPPPPLDVGPVEVEAVVQPDPQAGSGVVEMRVRMHADRLVMQVR